jgi:hypothetical protein
VLPDMGSHVLRPSSSPAVALQCPAQVESLASLSSRQHMDEGLSRCYSKLLLCNKVGLA